MTAASRRWASHPRLRWLVRGVLVAAAIAYLSHEIRWRDRYSARIGDREVAGVAVERGLVGSDEALQLPDGSLVPLRPGAETESVRFSPGLKSVLVRSSAVTILVVATVYLLGLGATAVRWWALMRLCGVPLKLGRTWRAVMRGQTVGLILPGSLGGDLYRIGFAVKEGASASIATASVALDRLIGLWVLLLGASGVATFAAPSFVGRLAPNLFAACLGAPFFALLASPLARQLARRWPERLAPVSALWERARERPAAMAAPLLLSVVNSSLQIFAVLLLIGQYWGGEFDRGGAALGAALGFLASAVPILPGGVGVGDAAFVWLFDRVGVSAAATLAALVTYRFIVYAVAGIGALLFLSERAPIERDPSERG